MPSPFYSASEVLYQFHGGMVSHIQALARDVASGADRHLLFADS